MATEKRLIDANDLLHDTVWLCGGFVGDPYSDGYMEALDNVEKVIREFPKVDAVEVVHGRWTRKQIGKYTGLDEVCCSVCGCFIGVVSSDTGFRTAIEGMSYCPNCGAKNGQ